MTSRLFAVSFGAHDPLALAQFWSGVLGWSLAEDPAGGFDLLPDDDTGFRIRFRPTGDPKVVANRIHFDLTSRYPGQQEETVARALELGARHIDIGQGPDEGQVVLADPEGNELCVIEFGNNFLADCGFIGAVNGDGTQAVGYFWSEALGWPLVWDENKETAIRSPYGGPKFTWSGPPVAPQHGRNRIHFDLVPTAGTDQPTEVDRLLALGATRLNAKPGAKTVADATKGADADSDGGAVTLVDPDGNEFRVLAPFSGDGR
jgi:hypothetical protein